MSKSQRTKGHAAEREVVKIFKDAGFVDAERNLTQTRDGGSDILNCSPLCIEVKRQERMNLTSAHEQVRKASGNDECAVLVHRSNRQPWLVTVTLDDFLDVLHDAGYTRRA